MYANTLRDCKEWDTQDFKAQEKNEFDYSFVILESS